MTKYRMGLHLRSSNRIGSGKAFQPVYSNNGKINFRASVSKQGRSFSMPSMSKYASSKKVGTISYKASFQGLSMRQPIQRSISSKAIQKFASRLSPSPKIKSVSKVRARPSKGRGR